MSSVNNILYSIQNMAPALLNIGSGSKSSNYDNLAALNSSIFGSSSSSVSSLLNNSSSTSSSASDKVSLSYKSIGDKIVSDMASVTASTIKEYPELDKNYVIALVDDGTTREAKVYKRSEILANFTGTEKEKKALESQLEANPLMVFSNGSGMPDSASNKASQALADNLNAFLQSNNKSLNILDKAGYDPLANMMADTSMKKTLAKCANTEVSLENQNSSTLSRQFLEDLKKLVDETVKSQSSLKDDYVLTIIDDGTTREARVYSRADILSKFEGSEEDKKALEKDLSENSLMVFLNDKGLPESSQLYSYEIMASAVNKFLQEHSEDIDKLDKAGYNPLVDLLGDSGIKKVLANYASSLAEEE